jgi:hypothetical protein
MPPARTPPNLPGRSDDRGQASVIGIVLLLSLVIGGSTVIVALGAGFFQETESRLSAAQSEKVLKLVDSRAALVALGGPSTDTVRLSDAGTGQYRVDGSAGWMNVTATDRSGTATRVMNLTLGKVEYETEAVTLAYQGGGVWKNVDSGGQMVSPPEFKYRDGTLTLPMINVTGQGPVSGRATIEAVGTQQVFPDPGSSDLRNPLQDQRINVTVRSEFYRAWGQYFEQRTSSEVRYVPSRDTVHVTLVPPPQPVTFDSAVTASGNLSIKSGASGVDGNITLGGTTDDESKITGTTRENVDAVSQLTPAASKITATRARLQNESAPGNFSTVTAGRYFVDDDTIFGTQTTFDTTDGDIVVFVDGDVDAGPGSKGGANPKVTFQTHAKLDGSKPPQAGGGDSSSEGGSGSNGGGNPSNPGQGGNDGQDGGNDNDEGDDSDNDDGGDGNGNDNGNGNSNGKGNGNGNGNTGTPDLRIVGDGTVRVYVNGTYDMTGQAVWGSPDETDSLITYSRDVDRFTKYYGAIYTGAVEVAGGGKYSPNVEGAVVSTADDVEMTGNADIGYDDSLGDRVIESVETEFAEISYLHISANTVRIAG